MNTIFVCRMFAAQIIGIGLSMNLNGLEQRIDCNVFTILHLKISFQFVIKNLLIVSFMNCEDTRHVMRKDENR